MTAVIDHRDQDNRRVVNVGESQPQVPLKIYQAIYHQVTGRTEQIRKRYTDNLLIDFSELEQIHHKISQLCDVHNIVAKNATATVFHDKERKEQFTSFERFRAYNGNTSSPTISVVLKYNFSIIPAGLDHPQEYVVNIRLTSRVAALKQLEEEAPPFMRGRIFSFMGGTVAEITVEYADYVVARGFLEAFDEWVNGCKCNPKSKILRRLQRFSVWIPSTLQILAAILLSFFATQTAASFLAETSDQSLMARFIAIYIGASYAIIRLTGLTGGFIEQAIDGFPEISYLKLNKGDEKLISEAEKAKPFAYIKLALAGIITFALNILSSKIESLL